MDRRGPTTHNGSASSRRRSSRRSPIPCASGSSSSCATGPLSVTQIQEATGVPGSSVSQQLAVLRGRSILATERRGTTIIYSVADPELFELLDVARRLFNNHLHDTIDLLRLVDDEVAAREA